MGKYNYNVDTLPTHFHFQIVDVNGNRSKLEYMAVDLFDIIREEKYQIIRAEPSVKQKYNTAVYTTEEVVGFINSGKWVMMYV